jgi:hypothetical protein
MKSHCNTKDNIRLLYLASDRIPRDELGFHDAFEKMLASNELEDYRAISFYHYAEQNGWDRLWRHVTESARQMGASVIFIQSFLHGPLPRNIIATLRRLPSQPTIVGHTCDVFGVIRGCKAPKCFVKLAAASDVTFLCGMGRLARQFRRKGVRNIHFLPNSVCQVRFSAPLDPMLYQPEFDVVFIANRMRFRNPLNRYPGCGERDKLVRAFSRHYGKRFAVFGEGWQGHAADHGPVPFNNQHEVYRRSRICIGHPAFHDIDYYCSNRTFIAIASGIPYLESYVPRLETILEDKKHCFMYRSIDEAVEICDKLLQRDNEYLLQFGGDASRYVLGRHTDEHRMRLLLGIVAGHRNNGNPTYESLYANSHLFLDSVNIAEENKHCCMP